MTDHCPACTVARELRGHRDATATEWSCRRAMLNFAAIVADRACAGYVPASENPQRLTGKVPETCDNEASPGPHSWRSANRGSGPNSTRPNGA